MELIGDYEERSGAALTLNQLKEIAAFVMLQNDALDRFGTRLEQRFSKKEITEMIGAAGFDLATLKFSDVEPFWTFSVKKL